MTYRQAKRLRFATYWIGGPLFGAAVVLWIVVGFQLPELVKAVWH